MREIKKIIIHCSATKEGVNYTVEDIDLWHRRRGYSCIGYHYVIYLDGSIHYGRPEYRVGAHCKNHNIDSIGICYIGGLDKDGKPKDTRTPEQKKALITLIKRLKGQYRNNKITVYGHRDFANKDCPCFDAKTEYANI